MASQMAALSQRSHRISTNGAANNKPAPPTRQQPAGGDHNFIQTGALRDGNDGREGKLEEAAATQGSPVTSTRVTLKPMLDFLAPG